MARRTPLIPANCPRVLVVMLDYHLGDFTIALPVIDALAAYFNHGIDLAVFHSHAPLVRLLPTAARIRVLPYVTEKKRRDWRQHLNFLRLAGRVLVRHYGAVFTLSGRGPCAQLTLASLARHRIGTPSARHRWAYRYVPAVREGGHRLDDFTPVLEGIGQAGRPPLHDLVLPPDATARAHTRLRACLGPSTAYAVIHTTAGKRCRQWPAERFARVAQSLVDRHDLAVVLIGTPGERTGIEALTTTIHRPGRTAVVTEALNVTLALLREARLFVCNFSGPTHLAGLCTRAPIVCVSGPTNTAYWGPLNNPQVTMLHGPICPGRCRKDACTIGMVCVRDVTVTQVLEAVARSLAVPPTAAAAPVPPAFFERPSP